MSKVSVLFAGAPWQRRNLRNTWSIRLLNVAEPNPSGPQSRHIIYPAEKGDCILDAERPFSGSYRAVM